MAFDRSMADLCRRSFFSCKDNTLYVRINNNSNNNLGSQIEVVARELSGGDKKAAENSSSRKAHRHLTLMYEAFITEVIEKYYSTYSRHAR